MQPARSFPEFWLQHLLAHRHPVTRGFHFVGTLLGWGLLIAAMLLRKAWLVLAAVVRPYALAWFSHFFVEHNRPATFGHLLWSWLAEQKMVALMLTGGMSDGVQRDAGELGASGFPPRRRERPPTRPQVKDSVPARFGELGQAE